MCQIENYMLPCPYKYYLGIDCPGCGFQRSLWELIQGNFISSIYIYPALIPILMMLLFLLIHLKFNLRNGSLILKTMFIINVSIIVTNYIVKMFLVQNYY